MNTPTWRERIAAALMDIEYGGSPSTWRPDSHIDMVRLDPDYYLCKKPLAAADALIASGVLGIEPVIQSPVAMSEACTHGAYYLGLDGHRYCLTCPHITHETYEPISMSPEEGGE